MGQESPSPVPHVLRFCKEKRVIRNPERCWCFPVMLIVHKQKELIIVCYDRKLPLEQLQSS